MKQPEAEPSASNVHGLLADLKACSTRRDLQWGRRIHKKAVETRNDSNIYVVTALIRMYAKCSSMVEARQIFDSVRKPNVVAWTALLLGYAEHGEGQVSLDLFSKMKAEGCVPDSVAYVAALKACTSLAANGNGSGKAQGLEMGCRMHLEIGHHLDSYVQSALIDMYATCGSMLDARRVFNSMQKPDVVSWTALLMGYAENGEEFVSLELFSQMKADGCVPNSVTYVAALKACTSLAVNGGACGKAQGLEIGTEIHLGIGEHLNLYVQSALIDMYAKSGSMVDSHRVFESIRKPDVVAWTALLLGYAENGEGHIPLKLLSKMEADGCAPNTVTYIAALKACGLIGALALGRKFHSRISEFTVPAVTCLVEFYAKCGSMAEARAVFDQHPKTRDISTWTVLLAGYSSCGDTDSVFVLFEEMQHKGCRPDATTFACLLLCCSHAGLVRKAWHYLEAMPVKYGVAPNVHHYSCVLDALGRANQLMEAVSLLRRMPCSPNAVTWSALLDACCKWKSDGLGRMALQSLLEVDEAVASAFVLSAAGDQVLKN